MKNIKLFLYSFVVLVIICSIGNYSRIHAGDEFNFDYDVTYTFDNAGKSTVAQQVTITNKQTGVYAPSYTFKIKGETPTDIKVESQGKAQTFKTIKSDSDFTDIIINFSDPATGRGSSNTFTITYTGRPAIKNGQIWELALAKLTSPELADSYQLHLKTPTGLGNPAYISPVPSKTDSQLSGFNSYHFTKDQVVSSGVVAGFGNFQTLDFNLAYNLTNTTSSTTTQSIALPPDTSLQRLFYDSIDPQPDNVLVDSDGNWLASYSLTPGRSQLIVARGQVHLLGSPVSPDRIKFATANLASYLVPQDYWPSNTAVIQSLARTYSTPKTIFDYVVKTLSYDYTRISSSPDRRGAVAALASPEKSICTDFTDVFISIARAAGIPTREHQGFALSTDPRLQPLGLVNDVLHAWPEYWDAKSEVWRSVDPTWTATSGGANYFDNLGLSHFTFVIHGGNDRSPLPAGMYKSAASKDVAVKVGDYRDFIGSPPTVRWQLPLFILPFISTPGSLIISNPSGTAEYNLGVKMTSSDLQVTASPNVVDVLPPFGKSTYTFTIRDNPFSFLEKKVIYVTVGSHLIAYNVPEVKFYLWYAILILTSVAAILGLAIFAHRAGHLYLQRRK